ncbi:MAG: hypothetical protein KC505_04150 [Myxococcales bacterium]|nr:hypothetical protein [Myxococcales bacterium]USN50196.1 MAG: hypothetical protein H6731_07980 [Myxococcales bacterium]
MKASCCASGSSGGIGRLLPYERALIELSHDAHYIVGQFNESTRFRAGVAEPLPVWQFNHELQVMTRLAPFFLPFIKLPVRTKISSKETISALADLSLGARWPIVKENYFLHWPGLNLFSTLQMPTGTSSEKNAEFSANGSTGAGVWLLSLGANVEKSLGKFLWTFAYTYSFETRLFKKHGYAHGPTHAPSINVSFPLIEMHQLSFGLSAVFNEPFRYDAKRVRNSSNRKISLSSVYAWKFHSHMTLNCSLGADMPIYGLGKNTNSEIFMRLGMRVGVF